MAKVAEKHYKVDPWAVIEDRFDPGSGRISESVFSLANEYMGVRGYFDEGYSGDRLVGCYVNGLYERMDVQHPQVFKGVITEMGFGVNTVDWLYARISLDGEQLDLARSRFTDFQRSLDLKAGTLTRSFIWHAGQKQLRVTFLRFCSMVSGNVVGQRITLEPLNFSGQVTVTSGLDFSPPHEIAAGWSQVRRAGEKVEGKNFWTVVRKQRAGAQLAVMGQTERSRQWLYAACRLGGAELAQVQPVEEPQLIALKGDVALKQGQPTSMDKLVFLHWERNGAVPMEQAWSDGQGVVRKNSGLSFQQALDAHTGFWKTMWEQLDIAIDGDDEIQQGVRFSLFQLYSTYQGKDPGINIPCKGMTAEVYFGWMFWDSETYCLPMYVFIDPKAARALLEYRHIYLPQALERARQVDCRGARYPFATIDGTECCGTWQHGDLEIHVDLGITYAVWLYDKLTGDKEFIHARGVEMLLQISRFLASRGEWNPKGKFGFYGVMGPDEFHMMVNNNCYTNVLAKKTFEYTLRLAAEMKRDCPRLWKEVSRKVGLEASELRGWKKMARKMIIPYDRKTGLYEQHEGYFGLPEVDVKNIPPEQIPIYKNWAYEKIFRYNMIKQPDFLLLPLFFSAEYDLETKRRNYEYYEARCIHESSLSPGIHSILAAELGKDREAYDFFRYMARLDLDNYNRNSEQGLHITAMSGVWLNVVNGFAGLRTDGAVLSFAPCIPASWNSYRFRLAYRGSVVEVAADRQAVAFKLITGRPVDVLVYGRQQRIDSSCLRVPLEKRG